MASSAISAAVSFKVMIRMSASAPANPFPEPPAGLKGVTHVVAVSSCKARDGRGTLCQLDSA